MDKTRQIESKEDFLKWAHDVNFSSENKRTNMCDLQDVFCRNQDGEMNQLKAWFLDSTPNEKQLLTFSIIKAMGEETAYRFIKTWARRQANIAIEEQQSDIQAEYQKLANDRMAFLAEKREIENRLNDQSIEMKELKDDLHNSRIVNDGLHSTVFRMQQTIDTQCQDLDAAYKALNEADKFKAYLKTVISSDIKID